MHDGTRTDVPRPGFDAELRAGLAVVGGMFPPTITPDLIDFRRISYASPPMAEVFDERRIDVTEVSFPGYQGADLGAAVLRSRDAGLEPTPEHMKLAERRVRLGLLLAEIGNKHDVTVPESDVQRAIFAQASSTASMRTP